MEINRGHPLCDAKSFEAVCGCNRHAVLSHCAPPSDAFDMKWTSVGAARYAMRSPSTPHVDALAMEWEVTRDPKSTSSPSTRQVVLSHCAPPVDALAMQSKATERHGLMGLQCRRKSLVMYALYGLPIHMLPWNSPAPLSWVPSLISVSAALHPMLAPHRSLAPHHIPC